VACGFDYGNRLRSGGPETYRYDVQGRRIRSVNGTGQAIYSLYDQAGQLLFQRDERATQSRIRQYVYLGGSLVAESDRRLSDSQVTVTYQHTDALGSPVATTSSAKAVLQRSEYEPYGYLLNRPVEDGPGYTGHVTDAATGLVYMQQRYYDPLCGCFLSTDPVTAIGGAFNRYWYANANPYRMVDPDGRWPKWLTEIFGISTDSAGAKHEVNQFAENMVGSKYESMAKPVQQVAETASKIVDTVDQRAEVSVEGTLAEGAAVKGSVDVTRGKAAVGIAPIAGQGARLAVSISPRNPIRIPLVQNAKEAPVRMNLFEVHLVDGIGGGIKVGMNGGYLEIKPSLEFGAGVEFIKYPSVEFGGN
jgi:RHS repeat-associated protein